MPTNSHFSEHQKRIILENAVASVRIIRAIKDQSDQNFSHSGRELTHEKYSNLLLSAANKYDIKNSPQEGKAHEKSTSLIQIILTFLVILFLISQKKT